MIDAGFLGKQKENLLKRKRELEKELKMDVEEEKEDEKEEASPDLLDRAAGETLVLEKESQEEILKIELNDVDHSLGKVESGQYGICEKCGHEIEKERLEILSTACLCLSCKMVCDKCGMEIEEARVLGKKIPAHCQNCEEEFEPQVTYTSSLRPE